MTGEQKQAASPYRCIDMEQLTKYMFERSEEFQERKFWDSSFECLYLITVLNRGFYWDRSGRHRITLNEVDHSALQQVPAPDKYTLTLSALREISADKESVECRTSCIHDTVCQWLCTAANCPYHEAVSRHDAAIAAAAYEKCMDDFGILHGDDAKRFNEYLEKPPVMTEERRETIRRAHEIVKDMKKKECSEFVEEAIKQYRERIRNMISKSRIFEDFTVLDILAIIDEVK